MHARGRGKHTAHEKMYFFGHTGHEKVTLYARTTNCMWKVVDKAMSVENDMVLVMHCMM